MKAFIKKYDRELSLFELSMWLLSIGTWIGGMSVVSDVAIILAISLWILRWWGNREVNVEKEN